MSAPAREPRAVAPASLETLAPALASALAGLRFGTIELTVHDGRVVQIERREKIRLEIDRTTGGPLPDQLSPERRRRPDDRSASDRPVGETR